MSFVFGGNTGLTYEQVQARRRIADQMMSRRGAPRNVGEGIEDFSAKIAGALIGRKADREDKRLSGEADALFNTLLGGGAPSTFSTSGPAPSSPGLDMGSTIPVPRETVNVKGQEYDMGAPDMVPFRNAIASIESAGSGDYAAVGPTHPKLGRALGRYQIMEANIGPWSREVLGQEITPEQFMADPRLQDAIFDGKFGQYVQQFGPEGAAQAWFAGPGGVGQMGRKDVLGTSVADYTRKFAGALGGNPGVISTQGRDGGAPGGNFARIAAALSNPYIARDPGRVAVLNALMQRELAASQPMSEMDALRLERERLELDRLRNPQPAPGFRLANEQEQAAYGGPGQIGPDGRFYPLNPGPDTVVNVGGDGAPQPQLLGTQGLVAIPDPNVPEGFRVVPAPGSPIAVEREAAARQSEQAAQVQTETEQNRAQIVTETTSKIRDALKAERDPKTGQYRFNRGWFDLPETGIVGGRLAGGRLNQEAVDVSGMLDTLKGMVVFDRLEKLKQASATGASGLGQVTEREIALLAAQLGALDINLSPRLILETIDTVDQVFSQLSPTAQAYLMGQTDAEPWTGQPAPEGDDAPPEGVDPVAWQYMTPEEKALFR